MVNKKILNENSDFKSSDFNIKELPGVSGNAYSSSRYILYKIEFNKNKYKDIYYDTTNIKYESDINKYGGIILFSSDNDEKFFDNLSNWLKENIIDFRNNTDNQSVGFTLGNYFSGTYKINEKIFDKNSLSLQVIGIQVDKLLELVQKLCVRFAQKILLVKSCDDRLFLIQGKIQ